MSLFSSIQMAGNTLQAMQIGLHVVGNNIANANTPGYVREKAIFAPAPVQRLGQLTIGLGVTIEGIVQNIDNFAEARLRDAGGDRAAAETQESTYRDLEVILDSLGEADVSTKLTEFFNSLQLINDQPENLALKNLAISAGEQLAQTINTLNRRIDVVHDDLNARVGLLSDEINTISEEIRQLNLRIVELEGGGATGSDAGGLRTQRSNALQRLSEIADVQISETPTGTVNVSLNGQFLVFEGTRREVETQQLDVDGKINNYIVYSEDNAQLQVTSGTLGGIYQARDTIVGGFLSGLDEFAGALTFEFNKVYSQGQGEVGFTSLTSTYRVDDPLAALHEAGLEFDPQHGEFSVLIHNKNIEGEGDTVSHIINVDLLGTNGEPTTLTSLAAELDAISGITATVSLDNELVIESESPADIEFGFEKDSSGILAALGFNTFFTGSDAGNISVNQELLADETAGAKFAAGLDGRFNVNADNTLQLVDLQDKVLSDQDGRSITGIYQQLIDLTTQGATTAGSVAEGLRTFEGTLEAATQSVSGVNLDEEAIDMIQLQRAYQASARYIQTLSELLDILVNI